MNRGLGACVFERQAKVVKQMTEMVLIAMRVLALEATGWESFRWLKVRGAVIDRIGVLLQPRAGDVVASI